MSFFHFGTLNFKIRRFKLPKKHVLPKINNKCLNKFSFLKMGTHYLATTAMLVLLHCRVLFHLFDPQIRTVGEANKRLWCPFLSWGILHSKPLVRGRKPKTILKAYKKYSIIGGTKK